MYASSPNQDMVMNANSMRYYVPSLQEEQIKLKRDFIGENIKSVCCQHKTPDDASKCERKVIYRASAKFGPTDNEEEEDAKIENERLKTTLLILSKKLKMKEDEVFEGTRNLQNEVALL